MKQLFWNYLAALTLVSLPVSADTCEQKAAALVQVPQYRELASVPSPTTAQKAAFQELRMVLPENGRTPSVDEAFDLAKEILATLPPAIIDGKIAFGEADSWRAAEIYDAIRRTGNLLSREQSELADAYVATRTALMRDGVVLPVSQYSATQQESLRKTFALFGVPTELKNGKLQFKQAVREDPQGFGRALFLLQSFDRDGRGFEKAFDDLIVNGSDIIASRGLPRQITELPEVYTRWERHRVGGSGGVVHQSGTMLFEDPTGRMRVISASAHIVGDERLSKTISGKIEAIQLVSLPGEAGLGPLGMRFSSRTAHTLEPRSTAKCATCHRTGNDGQLYTVVPDSRVEGSSWEAGDIEPGPTFRSKWMSSKAIRQGIAERASGTPPVAVQ